MREALLLLLIVGVVGALWAWSTRARESVLAIVSEVCRDLELQRLDDSVALHRLRLQRTPAGLRMVRIYRFEFTIDGTTRYAGDVALTGDHLSWVRVGHPQGDIHIDLSGGKPH